MLIGYIRSSKHEPGYRDKQHRLLRKAGVDVSNIFEDQASEHFHNRSSLIDCLKILQKGDTLIIAKLDRIGTCASNLMEIIDKLQTVGVFLKILNGSPIQLDANDARQNLMRKILNELIAYDRLMSPKRAKAARAVDITARRFGGYAMTIEKFLQGQAMLRDREPGTPSFRSLHEIARILGFSMFTLKRYLHKDGSPTPIGRVFYEQFKHKPPVKAKTRGKMEAFNAAYDR